LFGPVVAMIVQGLGFSPQSPTHLKTSCGRCRPPSQREKDARSRPEGSSIRDDTNRFSREVIYGNTAEMAKLRAQHLKETSPVLYELLKDEALGHGKTVEEMLHIGKVTFREDSQHPSGFQEGDGELEMNTQLINRIFGLNDDRVRDMGEKAQRRVFKFTKM
jgi:hypothetical protein